MKEMLWNRLTPFLSKHYASFQMSSLSSATVGPPIQPWLFIGLGNPGEKYQSTRHNVGFDMIDAFAQSQGIPMITHYFKALFGEGLCPFICTVKECHSLYGVIRILLSQQKGVVSERLVVSIDAGMVDGVPVLLAKPQTYMNLSGESAGPLAAYYKLPLNRVLVVYDDMDLPCGVLRLQPKGGYGRHNGLKSVINNFRRNREFCRLRIGIGRPPGQMDPKAFVLQKFNRTGRERIDSAIKEGVEILKIVATKGLTEAARLSNVDQKYKHLRSHGFQD